MTVISSPHEMPHKSNKKGFATGGYILSFIYHPFELDDIVIYMPLN